MEVHYDSTVCTSFIENYKVTGGFIREINKAFCGFSDGPVHAKCETLSKGSSCGPALLEDCTGNINNKSKNHSLVSNSMLYMWRLLFVQLTHVPDYCHSVAILHLQKAPAAVLDLEGKHEDKEVPDFETATHSPTLDQEEGVEIVTGNWGCGAFGGDPQLKTMIQWLAASQVISAT